MLQTDEYNFDGPQRMLRAFRVPDSARLYVAHK